MNEDIDVDVDTLNYELERDTILFANGPDDKNFKRNGHLHFGNFFTRLIYHWMNIKFVFNNTEFRYFLFYSAVSVCAFSVTEVLYSMHLFDIIVKLFYLKIKILLLFFFFRIDFKL